MKLINKDEQCKICFKFSVVPIIKAGGSDVIIRLSEEGVEYICLNCGAKYKK